MPRGTRSRDRHGAALASIAVHHGTRVFENTLVAIIAFTVVLLVVIFGIFGARRRGRTRHDTSSSYVSTADSGGYAETSDGCSATDGGGSCGGDGGGGGGGD